MTENGLEVRQKRWVRVAGLVPMAVYSGLVFLMVHVMLSNSIFRAPNDRFPGLPVTGYIALFFFMSLVCGSGVVAILTGAYMRGVYRVLYLVGTVAAVSSAAFMPMIFVLGPKIDRFPDIPGPQFLVGTWVDEDYRLELFPDSTYTLTAVGESSYLGDEKHY